MFRYSANSRVSNDQSPQQEKGKKHTTFWGAEGSGVYKLAEQHSK
jgi:hypothetical protein